VVESDGRPQLIYFVRRPSHGAVLVSACCALVHRGHTCTYQRYRRARACWQLKKQAAHGSVLYINDRHGYGYRYTAGVRVVPP
jgi:hypothetical protein